MSTESSHADHRMALIAVTGVFATLSTLAVILRIAALTFRTRRIGYDDLWVFIASVYTITTSITWLV
ncbi:MAG: hypothetical protein M1834_006121 [Cirrosporium novae-zelandiae]|nr:MAG: hypothetical protein M1834_006121 [Cirrosporium novae-zelandiae]